MRGKIIFIIINAALTIMQFKRSLTHSEKSCSEKFGCHLAKSIVVFMVRGLFVYYSGVSLCSIFMPQYFWYYICMMM